MKALIIVWTFILFLMLVFVGVTFIATPALSQTPNIAQCSALGSMAETVMEARHIGMPYTEIMQTVIDAGDSPNKELVVTIIDAAYDTPRLSEGPLREESITEFRIQIELICLRMGEPV